MTKALQQFFVNICHSSYAGLSVDLIDTYLQVAENKYGSDEKLMKKIKGSGFDGGLKWNSQRAMYILDLDNREEGFHGFFLIDSLVHIVIHMLLNRHFFPFCALLL